jgi:transposase
MGFLCTMKPGPIYPVHKNPRQHRTGAVQHRVYELPRILPKLFGKASGVGRCRTLSGMKKSYSTDLSDSEWGSLELHVPAPNERGRPKTHSTREILNAIFYVLRSGCPWRLLPGDFPPWESVYWWFQEVAHKNGTFEHLNAPPYARYCEPARVGTRTRARAHSGFAVG